MKLEKILYKAEVTTTGGRDGVSVIADNYVDLHLANPKELHGTGQGLNPEQLFAAGYSSCFLDAMKYVAAQLGIKFPEDASINGKVSVGTTADGFSLSAEMHVSIPQMDRGTTMTLIEKAHSICPYSVVTRGNMEVLFKVLGDSNGNSLRLV